MDTLLNQLGGMVLGSVPTMILLVLLVIAYGFLVRRPLDAVLVKRRALTVGAVEQARSAMSAAESETSAFEEKLRAARAEIFAARDRRLKQWAEEREAILAEAKAATASRVDMARMELEKSAAEAREQIEAMSGELSAKILKAVLPAGFAGTEAVQ
jgi:F-type H+-transporting ATPase subunit b